MHSVPRVVECIEQAEPTVEQATPVKDEGDVTEKLLPTETRSPVVVACAAAVGAGDGGEKLSPTSTNSQDAVLHAPLTSAASMSIKELSEEEEEDAAASEPLVGKQSEQESNNDTNVLATVVHRGSGDSAASESAPKSAALSLPAEDLLSMSGSESGISNSGTPGAPGAASSAASLTPTTATATTAAAASTAGTNSLTVAEAPERSRRKLSVQGE